MRSDIAPGGAFPDYELPDHMGAVRKLSELQGEDPLILMLARGHYCPKEHQQHLELAAFYPKIRIRFNAIAPGVVNTSTHADDSKDDLKSQSPMGEISEIQDIVDAVIYLTGARHVTGEVLHVDAGEHTGKW